MIECVDSYQVMEEDFDFSFFDEYPSEIAILFEKELVKPQISEGAPQYKLAPIKSSKKVNGAKLRRKVFRPRNQAIDNSAAIQSLQYRNDVRKRHPMTSTDYRLYAFPSFDRSDALLFLPSTLATHFNSANEHATTKLIKSHFDKNCMVLISCLSDDNFNANLFIKFNELVTNVHPDAFMCVHSTKVIENQIKSAVYMKFTACKSLYDSVSRCAMDPLFTPIFGVDREQSMKRLINREGDTPEHQKQQYYALVEAEEDLVVYVKAEMVLTIDDLTRKVTCMTMSGRVTSMVKTEV